MPPSKTEARTSSEARIAESVLLYYLYEDLDEELTEKTRRQQLVWCKELDLMGRIRVTPEGLNGTLDGSNPNLQEYTRRMDAIYKPKVIDWKWAAYPATCERRFRSVSVKIKDEVVGMALSEEEQKGMLEAPPGKHLTATEWHEELKKDDDSMVLLDVRNFYETRVGHFRYGADKKALDPMTRSFSEFKNFVEKEGDSLKDKKVLMYCTGGVRCERASQFMRYKGIDNVFQLYGGIHRYQEEYPDGFFKGKNFVYDPRVAVGGSDHAKEHNRRASADRDLGDGAKVEEVFCSVLDIFNWLLPSETSPASTDTVSLFNNADIDREKVEVVGRCMLCGSPYDDYHSPYDKGAAAQTRCSYCRVLCLVCNSCKLDESRREDVKELRCEMCVERRPASE